MNYKIYVPQAIFEIGKRENQEDSIYPAAGSATESDRLFVVCDGMGGHEHGEVASQNVVRAMSEHLLTTLATGRAMADSDLIDALTAAYARLDSLDKDPEHKMGTTLTLLCLHRGGVTAAHIGDSRIYHLRPATGEVRYVSRDHSLVMDLYQAGEITREQMRTSPQKNIITRAITPGRDERATPDIVHIADVKPGDYFFLCSDGMLERMTDDQLLAIVSGNTTDSEKRQALIDATAGNSDNHSAYLVRIASVENEVGDDSLPDDEATSRANAMNIYREREEADTAESVTVLPAHTQQSFDEPLTEFCPPTPKRANNKRRILPYLSAACLIAAVLAAAYILRPSENRPKQDTTKNSKVVDNHDGIIIETDSPNPKTPKTSSPTTSKATSTSNKVDNKTKQDPKTKDKTEPSKTKDRNANNDTEKERDAKEGKKENSAQNGAINETLRELQQKSQNKNDPASQPRKESPHQSAPKPSAGGNETPNREI